MNDIINYGFLFFVVLGFIQLYSKQDSIKVCHKYCPKHHLTTQQVSWCEQNGALYSTEQKKRLELIQLWQTQPEEAATKRVGPHMVCTTSNGRTGTNHASFCSTLGGACQPSTFNQHLFGNHYKQPLLCQLFLLSLSSNSSINILPPILQS